MAPGAVEVNNTTIDAKAGAVFDGVDDFVEVPHNSNQLGVALADGFTISAWIYSSGTPTTDPNGQIFAKGTDGGSANGFNIQFRTGEDRIRFTINNGTAAHTAATLVSNVWFHFLVTISSGQLANFYIDGVLSGAANQNLVQGISAITTTDDPKIGNASAVLNRPHFGTISKVKMWNKVLGADEIALDFAESPTPTADKNLIIDVPLQKNYNGVTNSGTYLSVVDDAVAAAVKADRTTANDQYMIACAEDGQVITTIVEESP